MNELALFAGAGAGLLATQHLLGCRTVCYVENAEYPVEVLKARIRDGFLDDAPIWGNIRTFDGRPWRGCVGLVTAGFPCQPFAKGGKRLGADDPRNCWPDTIRVVGEVQPEWVFLENSPQLLYVQRGGSVPPYIRRIVGELAVLGYVGRWGCLSAADLGYEHKRRRLWVVAYAGEQGRPIVLRGDIPISNENHAADGIGRQTVALDAVWNRLARLEERLGKPSVFGVDDGMANRVDRLTAIGEGQVPAVARRAWKLLK